MRPDSGPAHTSGRAVAAADEIRDVAHLPKIPSRRYRCFRAQSGCRVPGAGKAITVRANKAVLSVCISPGPVGFLVPA